jgi:hypothetical protein
MAWTARRDRCVGVQQFEVVIAMMLARERRHGASADAAGDGCTALAAALAVLPSGLLEMVANAVVALGLQAAPKPQKASRCSVS